MLDSSAVLTKKPKRSGNAIAGAVPELVLLSVVVPVSGKVAFKVDYNLNPPSHHQPITKQRQSRLPLKSRQQDVPDDGQCRNERICRSMGIPGSMDGSSCFLAGVSMGVVGRCFDSGELC